MKRLAELLFDDMGKVKEVGNDNGFYHMPKEILLKLFIIAKLTKKAKMNSIVY